MRINGLASQPKYFRYHPCNMWYDNIGGESHLMNEDNNYALVKYSWYIYKSKYDMGAITIKIWHRRTTARYGVSPYRSYFILSPANCLYLDVL